MTTETIELSAGRARVVIARSVGGSIASFTFDGQPILRSTPDDAIAQGSVRQFACFPLVPFSNRIADASLHWSGRDYALKRYIDDEPHAIHGNGWQRAWSVTRREASLLTLELVHDAIGARAEEWPFPYRARQCFELVAEGSSVRLDVELEIENTGKDAFPFGLGWHPYFDRDAQTELGFVARGVWQTDPSHVPTRLETTPPSWNFERARPIGDTAMDNCFAGWRPPAVIRWRTRKLVAQLAADPACEFLVVFTPMDASNGSAPSTPKPYFALEPVTHMTDAFNRAGKDGDTGTRVLAPGASFSCTMGISVSRNV
jgi:aldose 1-epimerase